MRHRSPTNSHHYENLPLRQDYADANMLDEISHLFPVRRRIESSVFHQGGATVISRFNEYATETHHIGSGILGSLRWDEVTNLIRLSRVTHVFCEDYSRDGLVLAMAAKIAKREWDHERMREIMGVASIAGWIAMKPLVFDFTRTLFEKAGREAA